MSTTTRVLFVATYPNQPIGYSKIANILSNAIAGIDNVNVYYFGFANFEGSRLVDRKIHPGIKFIDAAAEEKMLGNDELYGVNVISKFIDFIDPNYIFMYNDCIVISRLFNSINSGYLNKRKKSFKVIVYLDLVYDYQCPEYLQFIYDNSDKILVFSEHWKTNLRETLRDSREEYDNKVSVLHHGFNREVLSRLDKAECRDSLALDRDDFVILNANRNSYRKAWDITFAAFLIFLKRYEYSPKIRLFVHASMVSVCGYNFIRSIEIAGKAVGVPDSVIREKVLLRNIVMMASESTNVSDEKINQLYNACDVGINTCIGEGFGLCNMEQAVLGMPQVVSRVGAFNDIFPDEETVAPVVRYQVSSVADEHTGVAGIVSAADVADKLDDIYQNYAVYKKKYEKISKDMYDKYDWARILPEVTSLFV